MHGEIDGDDNSANRMNAFSQPSPSQRTANDEEGADAPIAFAPASIMPKPSGWKRVAFALAVLGAAGELVARYGVGLGDPPLSQADPQIEYLFKPNQDCRRLGRRVAYNQYSMRSDPFPVHKADPNEIRVMVVGDSVVNGGVLTDQSELATEVLKRKLAAKLNRPVVIGNISA